MPLSSLRFWRSKSAPQAGLAARRASRRSAAEPTPSDPAVERTRTRQRLLGAAVLLGLGVLVFGLLFETEPRPAEGLSATQLARRDAGPVMGAEPADSPFPALAAAEPSTAPTPMPAPLPDPAPARPATGESAPASQVDTGATPASPPPVALPPAAPTPSVAPSMAPAASPAAPPLADDGARARALLEGRPPAPAAGAAAPTPTATAPAAARYVVQVGAFSDPNALREARQRVERLGLKTYTQVVQTPAGARTRVRVGPFDDRAQAEAAAEKLRAARLPAALLKL